MRFYSIRFRIFITALIFTVLAILAFFINHWVATDALTMVLSVILFFLISYLILNFSMNKFTSVKFNRIYKSSRKLPVSFKKHQQWVLKKIGRPPFSKNEAENQEQNQNTEVVRLKELEKYRKDFVGNVSHEMKTPIFNIQGYILTLLEGGIDDPKINRLYLSRAEKSVDRMISIVEDLESITKLESGELKLKFERFDIVRMVEEVFDLEQRIASELNVTMEINQKPDFPVMVIADRKGILEVLTNLINNGIKYNKKNGSLRVTFYDGGEKVIVEISDTGIGIDKKDQNRIFERFYRVDKSRSREQGGTGLGLSIVKHIIEAHKQEIKVTSVLDEGTSFIFTLDKAN